MEEYTDNFVAENSALRRKLQSKSEALLILSKELDQCRTERDQFKLMSEQLQNRYHILKKKLHDPSSSNFLLFPDSRTCSSNLAEVISETKEQNKALRIEIEDLRQKLRDAEGDIKVLRARLNQLRSGTNVGENQLFPSHQREELVQQLETLNRKCTQLGADLQAVLDEKEELVTERDAFKCKVHRLNHELNTLLKTDSKKLVDVDALIMENRYLQERLKQAEEEKEMSVQALSKYKCMLDKKRNKGTVKLGTSNNTGLVMSHKQVQQLLERGTSAQLPNTAATLSDLKSLCLALLEALGDKTLALVHQKKANKILASRISELEAVVQGGAAFPSQLLLEGYASSEVDRDVGHILSSSDHVVSDSEGESVSSSHFDVSNCQSDKLDGENTVSRPKHDTGDNVSRRLASNSRQDTYQSVVTTDSNASIQDSLPLQDSLPPELQLLVQKALDEIKQGINVKD